MDSWIDGGGGREGRVADGWLDRWMDQFSLTTCLHLAKGIVSCIRRILSFTGWEGGGREGWRKRKQGGSKEGGTG